MNIDLSSDELSYLIHLMYFDRKMCLVDEEMCNYYTLLEKLQGVTTS